MPRVNACKSVVTLDYDMDYWDDIIIGWIRRRAEKLGATSVWCERSTNGGIHCTVCFGTELAEEERLVLETVLLDDPARIMNNLRRLLATGRLMDILFEVKTKAKRPIL